MATEESKKERLLGVFNLLMYGLIKGLWDLFGESSFATVTAIGDQVLGMLEKESGLEIHGENPKDIITEISRLLVDEVGAIGAAQVTMKGDKVSIACTRCFLRHATVNLEAAGVQPFACVPMTLSAAAMRKRLGTKHRVLGRTWDPATETCTIHFQLVSR